jgi:hydrogenase-4 component E
MNSWIETILILIVLTNLVLLGSGKVWRAVKLIAFQAPLLAMLLVLSHYNNMTPYIILLAAGTVFVKSIIIPWFLYRAVMQSSVNRAIEPFVGYNASILAGMIALLIALWLGARLPLPTTVNSPLVIPVAFYMIFVGLFLIVTRKKAINQVLGYLVLENGIYIFGALLIIHVPFMVEFGILLDLIAAVFLMGITLFHINQSFDHIDISRLSNLKDWKV